MELEEKLMLMSEMNREQLLKFAEEVKAEYEGYKALGLKLDMSRGKPSSEQLDLAMKMLAAVNSYDKDYKASDGTDCRNYGGLDGLTELKKLFSLKLSP